MNKKDRFTTATGEAKLTYDGLKTPKEVICVCKKCSKEHTIPFKGGIIPFPEEHCCEGMYTVTVNY